MRALKTLFRAATHPRNKFLTDAQTDLGNVLLKLGFVSEETLQRAVEIREAGPVPPGAGGAGSARLLGQVLVSMGEIDNVQLEEALLAQERLRNGGAADVMLERMHRRSMDFLAELSGGAVTASGGD